MKHDWTDEQIATLQRLWPQRSVSITQISHQVGRGESSVIGKAFRLGIKRDGSKRPPPAAKGGAPAPWPEEKVARLRELIADGLSRFQISEALGLSYNAVTNKMQRLGYRMPRRTHAKVISLPRRKGRPTLSTFEAYPEPLLIDGHQVGIMDLKDDMCARPLWGDEKPTTATMFYCGNPRRADSKFQYCAGCAPALLVDSRPKADVVPFYQRRAA